MAWRPWVWSIGIGVVGALAIRRLHVMDLLPWLWFDVGIGLIVAPIVAVLVLIALVRTILEKPKQPPSGAEAYLWYAHDKKKPPFN
jgi:hypothetical protein